MTQDEFQDLWQQHDANLDRCIELNERALKSVTMRRTKSVLSRHLLFSGVEIVTSLPVLFWLSVFIRDHFLDLRFFAPAATLYIGVIALTSSTICQVVRLLQIDYGLPVTTIQRKIEEAKLLEYRMIKWILLSCCLVWIPMLVVGMKGLLGVDVYRFFPLKWILVNVVSGLFLLVVGQWLSKKFIENSQAGSRGRRLIDHIAGQRLKTATDFLDELSRFEEVDAKEP